MFDPNIKQPKAKVKHKITMEVTPFSHKYLKRKLARSTEKSLKMVLHNILKEYEYLRAEN